MKSAITCTTIKALPREERPREKLVNNGPGTLSNAELLAILLDTGTRNFSAVRLADSILSLEQGGGIDYLVNCTAQELSRIPGIGMAKSARIMAAIELGKRISRRPQSKRINIKAPVEVANLFMDEMRVLKREFFKLLLLNIKNEIIAIEDAAIGNLDCSVVHPREVFCIAVKRSAAALIVVHNHPSGNPFPSQADLDITARLVDAGHIMGISVMDHLIIGDGKFISLKEQMLM